MLMYASLTYKFNEDVLVVYAFQKTWKKILLKEFFEIHLKEFFEIFCFKY